MFYICKSRPTTPGRFETVFWGEFNGTVGNGKPGWTNAKSYALTFDTKEQAQAKLNTLGLDRAYVSQIISAL